MRLFCLAATVAAVAAFAPANASNIYTGSVSIGGIPGAIPPVFSNSVFQGSSPFAFAGSASGATVSAMANDLNNGTTLAFGATTGTYFYSEAIFTAPLLYTGPAGTSARVRLTALGQLAATGTGDALVQFNIFRGNTSIFGKGDRILAGDAVRTRNITYSTVVTLTANTAFSYRLNARTFGGSFGSVSNWGSAYAYLDPVISFSSAVPEPMTWALLITGFGLVGAVQRRRLALA